MRFAFLDEIESRLQRQLFEGAVRDALTGAYNRKFFEDRARAEIAHSLRHGGQLSLVMLDIDHFKKINDVHGHLAGDYVLKELARVVRERLRGEEIFARYGGEEFCIVAPETPLEGMRVLAEDIRRRVAEAEFVFQGERISCTISCGVAVLGAGDKDGQSLIKSADEKLYVAKRSGRNKVCA